jgi:hypothetical protein
MGKKPVVYDKALDVVTLRYDKAKWKQLKKKYSNFNDMVRKFLDGLLNE